MKSHGSGKFVVNFYNPEEKEVHPYGKRLQSTPIKGIITFF